MGCFEHWNRLIRVLASKPHIVLGIYVFIVGTCQGRSCLHANAQVRIEILSNRKKFNTHLHTCIQNVVYRARCPYQVSADKTI